MRRSAAREEVWESVRASKEGNGSKERWEGYYMQ